MLFRTATVLIITWAGSSLCAQTPTDDHDQLQQILEARIDTEKRLTTIKNQLNNLQAKNLKLDKQLLNIPPNQTQTQRDESVPKK
jgi:hypothetical protein